MIILLHHHCLITFKAVPCYKISWIHCWKCAYAHLPTLIRIDKNIFKKNISNWFLFSLTTLFIILSNLGGLYSGVFDLKPIRGRPPTTNYLVLFILNYYNTNQWRCFVCYPIRWTIHKYFHLYRQKYEHYPLKVIWTFCVGRKYFQS